MPGQRRLRLWVPFVMPRHVLRSVVASNKLHARAASFAPPSGTATGRDAAIETCRSDASAFPQADYDPTDYDTADYDTAAIGPDAGTSAGDTLVRSNAAVRTECVACDTRGSSTDV